MVEQIQADFFSKNNISGLNKILLQQTNNQNISRESKQEMINILIRNMKIIFKNKLQKKSIELCGMKKVLLENFDENVLESIQKVIRDIPVKNPKNIAAAIYFIISIPISKGGIFSKKLKLKNGDYLTLEFISKFCKIVPSTISSAKDEIIYFYKNNPGLK